MEYPVVTVFTPIYKTGDYAIEAIESVLKQDYPLEKLEHIIVDDGSPDDSFDKVEAWVKKHNYKCKLIRHDNNKGIAAGCNTCIKNSSGSYLQFNGDDIFLPNKTKSQVETLIKADPKVVMTFSNAALIDEESNVLKGDFFSKYGPKPEPGSYNFYSRLIDSNFICAPSAMVAMEAIKEVDGYDERLGFEDYPMWINMAKFFDFHYLDEILVRYRIRTQSYTALASKQKDKILRHCWDHLRIYADQYPGRNAQEKKLLRKKSYQFLVKAYEISPAESQSYIHYFESKVDSLGKLGLLMRMRIPYSIIRKIL